MRRDRGSKMSVDEVIGWLGALGILLAFVLLLLDALHSKSRRYLLLNALGSFGILWISFKKKTYQPAIVNTIWCIFSIYGLVLTLSAQ